jgi:thiamine-phosphate pyrophosphorylase
VNPLPCPLLAVTDRTLCSVPLEKQVERIFAGGGKWLWFRDKDLPHAERKALAQRLLQLAAQYGARVSIGGDVDLAVEVQATAAHVSTAGDVETARQRMGAAALLGMSAHNLQEVKDAASVGADYATLSPIFLTSSKPGYGPALGADAIAEAAGTGLPIVALGGVTLENLASVRTSGASGAAMMGTIMAAKEPEAFAESFMQAWCG